MADPPRLTDDDVRERVRDFFRHDLSVNIPALQGIVDECLARGLELECVEADLRRVTEERDALLGVLQSISFTIKPLIREDVSEMALRLLVLWIFSCVETTLKDTNNERSTT